MGIGPVPATRGPLERSGRSIDDYDLVERNETFAIGHPLGASGARLPVTLVHEMRERDADRGVATECVGFGQGAAIEFSAG